MNKKVAVITGISGQDGSYMAELLLSKNYQVIGIVREGANLSNLSEIIDRLVLVKGELQNEEFVIDLIKKYLPNEIYNFAGISSVFNPWQDLKTVFVLNALVPIMFLDSIVNISPKTKFFQASSAEMFDKRVPGAKDETSVFYPVNPYGMAKLLVHQMIGKMREEKKLFAVSGILFNHESPRRGENFITRKISIGLSKIKLGTLDCLEMGFLDAERDWGYAPEYMEGIWQAMQSPIATDYVFATGKLQRTREFLTLAANVLGIDMTWEGVGENEVGKDQSGKVIIKINKDYYRKELVSYFGDITKIKREIGWSPKTDFKTLVEIMVKADYNSLSKKK